MTPDGVIFLFYNLFPAGHTLLLCAARPKLCLLRVATFSACSRVYDRWPSRQPAV